MTEIPDEVVAAAQKVVAAAQLADAEWNRTRKRDGRSWGSVPPDPVRCLIAAAVVAERERIYAELGNDHYVIFTEDRWTIEHSVECRLIAHMHECAYHTAISLITAEFDPDMAGRWRIDGIDSEGLPELTRADLIRAEP
jgi:hypothetical protein